MKKVIPALVLSAFNPLFATTFVHAMQIEEVVVTAQKREQSVQDVGITISAFSGDTLESMGVTNSNDIAAKIPNLEIKSPSGEGGVVSVFIRGIGLNDFAVNNTGPVGYYVDEVFAGSSNSQVTSLFDIERVEVLKGPQGTLFGRNTTGGALNIVSRKPTDELEGYIRANLGVWDNTDELHYTIDGAISGGITDSLAGRFAFIQRASDGYMTNTVSGDTVEKQNFAARALLDWTPSDTVAVLLNLHGSRNDSDQDLYGTTSDPDFFESPSEFTPKIEVDTAGASLKVDWDFSDNITLTSLTAYDELDKEHEEDSDMQDGEWVRTYFTPDTETFSQELRLTGDGEGLHWIAGLYYLAEDIDYGTGLRGKDLLTGIIGLSPGDPGFDLFDGGVGSFDFYNEQSLETIAGFGQVELDVSDDLTLTVGLRYTEVETEFEHQGVLYANAAVALGLVETPWSTPKLTRDEDAFSGKIALNYHVNEDIMTYASVTRGFKGGGFNGNFYFNPEGYYSTADQNLGLGLYPRTPEYDDETLTAYELGVKSTLQDGLMQLNVAVFFYDYQDAQVFNSLSDPTAPLALPTQSIFNAEELEIYGLDLDFIWTPVEGLYIQGGVGYINSEFKKAIMEDTIGTQAVLDGETPQNSPEWTASLLANYTWSLGSGDLTAQVDMSYSDEQFFSNGLLVDTTGDGLGDTYDRNEDLGEDSYTVWNARLSWSNDVYEVALWGKNLKDEEYSVYRFELSDVIGADQVMRSMPRTYGIEARYNF